MTQSVAGKGCRYRKVDRKKYDKNYDDIFKKKGEKECNTSKANTPSKN
jgi:hypothetical protein